MDNKRTSKSNFSLALLIFIAVFGITNIPNNYAVLGGEAFFWFVVLIIYFIPMALIMAELASYKSNTASGISAWVEAGTTQKIAFFCAWAYFIENIFYLPTLASRVPVFLSWMFADYNSLTEVVSNQGQVDGVINATSNHAMFLLLAFIVLLISVVITYYFETLFEKMGKFIGVLSLIIAFGFIVMTIGSVIILSHNPAYPLTIENTVPTVNNSFILSATTITSLVWIIFAIGGIETIGSVVDRIDNPKKRLPKIVTIGAVLVIAAYAIGILGISFILTPDQLSPDVLENAIPIMFAQAGLSIGMDGMVGVWFLKFIMLAEILITISATVLWFAATINVLFLDTGANILPDILEKKDRNHKPLNAIIFSTILILIFLIISSTSGVSNVYYTLYDMSTISMVIPFILLLISYIGFKKREKLSGYVFIKNKFLAMTVGAILLLITTFAFVFGVFDLTLLRNGIEGDFTTYFITSFGGLTFFMLIGLGIYLRKLSLNISDLIFIGIFLLAGYLFATIFYIPVIVFVGFIIYRQFIKKN